MGGVISVGGKRTVGFALDVGRLFQGRDGRETCICVRARTVGFALDVGRLFQGRGGRETCICVRARIVGEEGEGRTVPAEA